ncbi:CDP-alcohol phosphatidyltransferase family protein [Candidatus Uhrbacteria bacterium]|nr:CDP-alcohol phosphatidyltransferase family protein [Candidatus Uhrbacteria bacterium]
MNQRDPAKMFPHDYLMRYTIVPLVPRFITPNMVTLLRFFCIPFVLYFLAIENYDVGVPFFLIVALTDALDGSLARIRKQITEWGTFYDPLADKILISSVVLLVVVKHVNLVFGLIIIFLELLIIVGGYFRKLNGKITSANIFGKTKMFLQVVGVVFLLIAIWAGYDLFIPVSIGTLSLAIVFAVISLFTYGL